MPAPSAPKKARRSTTNRSFDESVYCDEEEDSQYNIYFVRYSFRDVDTPTAHELKVHEELFESLKESGVAPIWIGSEEVFNHSEKGDFFVLPIFRGITFNRLCEDDFKIYGPPIVAECLEEQKPLPSWDHPLYSSVFEGTTVCITSIDSEVKESLYQKIKWMNGIVGKGFYENTTHLIAGKADTSSEKYKVATRNYVKLMKKEWVEQLWERTQLMIGKFSAMNDDVITAYRLRVFEGIAFTITNLDGENRTNLMKLLEEHGGKVTGEMMKKSCSHLVTDHMTGEKYRKATEWKTVKIVQMRWIRKCIDLGYLVDEAKYHPRYLSGEHLRSSTPQRDQTVVESVPDVSSIAGTGGKLNISGVTSSILTPSSANTIEKMTRIFDRPNNSSVVSATTIEHNESPVLQSSTRLTVSKLNVPLPVVSDPIDDLFLNSEEDSDVFEGCMIWLCGVEKSKNDKWRQLLDRSGATRVKKIESATHVVVVSANQSEKGIIRKYLAQPDIVIVNATWIVECFKKKMLVPHEEFEWTDTVLDETQNGSQQSGTSFKRRVSGYASTTPETTRSLTRYSEDPPMQMKGVFASLKFYIHPTLNSMIARDMRTKIEKSGGCLVSNAESAGFVIFGHSAKLDTIISYDVTITNLYVDVCLVNEELIDISSHPLFVPLPKPPTNLFTHFLFVLYTSNEALKEYVQDLIVTNGGTVVEKPDNRIRDKVLYIVMEQLDVNRTDPRQRNRMLDLSWVVTSLSTCRIASQNEHLFNGEPLKNYERNDDAWIKCTKEREHTIVMDKNFEERLDLGSESSISENRNRSVDEGPSLHRNDLTKPFKMRLKLDGVHDIIDNIPSPCREVDESMTTSRIGEILKTAVVNTGRRDDVENHMKAHIRTCDNAIPFEKPLSTTRALKSTSNEQKPQTNSTIYEGKSNKDNLLNNMKIPVEEQRVMPVFVLSCSELPVETRQKLREDILFLGGDVQDQIGKETTHLIRVKMFRTPKLLSGIAAGVWCLIPEYVSRSRECGRWLPEIDFEWNLSRLDSTAQKVERCLAQSCKEWRVRVAEKSSGRAFSGWKCVLLKIDKRSLSVIPILEAGDASVRVVDEYVEIVPFKPTHVFTSKEFNWNSESAMMLRRAKIPLLSFEFIYEYLVNDNFDVSQCFHSAYRECL